jgi:hypothetical protein
MSKAKALIKLMEILPKGFYIMDYGVDVKKKKFVFTVSFPTSAAKGFNPPEGEETYINGVADLDVYWERPYRGSIEGPSGGGWDIGISYTSLRFVDEDKEVAIKPEESKVVVSFLEKNFEDEFLDRIEKEFEEDQTAYQGD